MAKYFRIMSVILNLARLANTLWRLSVFVLYHNSLFLIHVIHSFTAFAIYFIFFS